MGLGIFRMSDWELCMKCMKEACESCTTKNCFYCNVMDKCRECPKDFVNLDIVSSDMKATSRLNLSNSEDITNSRLWSEE
jgi:hypothetical protein